MSIFKSRSRKVVCVLLGAVAISVGTLALVTVSNTETPPPMPAVAPPQLVDELALAAAAGSWDEAAAIAADLSVWGDQALPAISDGLRRGDERLSRMLIRALRGIRSDAATSLLVSMITPALGRIPPGTRAPRPYCD